MVKYPPCFSCSHYNDEEDICPAFPAGVTDEVLKKKIEDGKDKECAQGIYYHPLEKE